MNSSERFKQTMHYGAPDRAPCFEEGIRDDVIAAWRQQGLTTATELKRMFTYDERVEIEPDLDPIPDFTHWPASQDELDLLEQRLDPTDHRRLPEDWKQLKAGNQQDHRVRMLRVHRGFFLSLGVRDWSRFMRVMEALMTEPEFIRRYLDIYGRFAARLADRVLSEIQVDAAIFSEPIGGNHSPIISPAMYRRFVLASYQPLLEVLRRHHVDILILRTYANARILVPSLLEAGFNCLWACEVNIDAMDYPSLRREFGRGLRLIGGIDLDTLLQGKDAIRREIEAKVAPLVADGGYVPLADGRVRPEVPFDHYRYYRELLEDMGGRLPDAPGCRVRT